MPKFKASQGFKMPGAPFMKKPVNTKDLGEDVTNDPRYKKAKDSGKKVYKSKTGQTKVNRKKINQHLNTEVI